MAARLAQVRRRHHRAERLLDRSPRVRQEPGDASERLVLFGVEHVEDCAHQQRMTGLFPMIALLEASFGIDQHIGDILHVAHLPFALTDFERSEEHTSELQSLMRISYAVFCLKKKKNEDTVAETA